MLSYNSQVNSTWLLSYLRKIQKGGIETAENDKDDETKETRMMDAKDEAETIRFFVSPDSEKIMKDTEAIIQRLLLLNVSAERFILMKDLPDEENKNRLLTRTESWEKVLMELSTTILSLKETFSEVRKKLGE